MSQEPVGGLYGAQVSPARQRDAFVGGSIPVAVYGLGKMGLPLASVYAETAGNVVGVDVDPTVVESVNAGDCHVTGEPGLPELVAEQVDDGRLQATTDGAKAAERASVHVVIVPTLVTDEHDPDLSTIESVVDDVAVGLSPGDLMIVESTVPPGTCRDVVHPTLAKRSGLDRGTFGLAFCPERTASRTALRDIRGRYPKVVGGVDDESARGAALIYSQLTDEAVHVVSDATTAEAVKVFEGIYRDVNIALANELATISDELGISVREAIETANHLPMCQLHDPGPGVGGHCIPYYPHFLLAQTQASLAVTETARTVNDRMPAYAVAELVDDLDAMGIEIGDASVLVLGITYRPAVDETRSSPALGVIDGLNELGAEVYGTDPIADPAAHDATPVTVEEVTDHAFDAAILVTPQPEFERIDWNALDPMVVLDGRDALDLDPAETHHWYHVLGGSRGTRPVVVTESEHRENGLPTATGSHE